MSEMTKDPVIGTKSVKQGVNKKGDDSISFSFSPEQAELLIKQLSSEKTDRGVKISMYLRDKVSENGRKFKSAFGFVNGIGEPPVNGQYGKAAPKVSVKVDEEVEDLAAKIEAMKAKLAAKQAG